MKHSLAFLTALLLAPLASLHGDQATKPTSLKTEFLTNPLVVDTALPRFSWIVEESVPGAKQTAYQVQAGSSPEKLAKGEADLWDTGKVESDQSHLVNYGGKPMVSRQRVWWRVKSWGNNGRETQWSDTASLEVGLLKPEDWSAQWIKAPDLVPVNNDAARVWVQMTTVPVITDNFLPGGAKEPASPVPAEELAKAEAGNMAILEKLVPCPLLRREVALQGAIRRGRAYVAAPGFFELRINGSKVGDKELEPGVTPFKEQVSYSVHDITPLLRQGTNAFGLILGHGWFDSGRIGHNVPVGTTPVARAQFEIEFEDGHRVVFGTDGEWKSAPSPILKDSHWLGECYDARLERVGWDQAGFDDGAWKHCLVTSSPTKRLAPDLVPAERVVRRIKAARLYSPAEGVWIYDMGEAFSGAAELKVTVPAGTALTLRYAQRVFAPDQPIGSLLRYQNGVARERTPGRLAPYAMAEGCAPSSTSGRRYHAHSPTDVYVASGRKEEVWRRRFSYTGYRYVELTGYPGKPPEDAVTGVVVHNDLPQEGTFKCSDERLNRLHRACLNTYLYCTHGFTQDNPTREKQYCPEMTSGCARLAATAFSTPMLWSKIVESSLLTQDASGHFRQFCGFRPSPEQPLHEDGTIRLAYLLWLRYGDDRMLRRGLDHFAAYLDYYWDNPQNRRDTGVSQRFLAAKDLSVGYLRGGFFCFDWYDAETVLDLPRGQHPPRDRQRLLWGTGVLLENLQMLVAMVAHAGREDLVHKFRALGEKVRAEWNQTFFNPATGSYGCQGNNALALVADLPTQENIFKVIAALVADIEKLGGRFTTGTHGFPRLMDALSASGHADLAYGMLSRESYPSLGHMLKAGNGTLFESWNTFTNPTGGSGSNIMQSERPRAGFWFAEWLGGIRPDPEHPGFQQFILGPVFPKELNSAHAEVASPYGRITSAWEKRGDSVHWNVTVPWNTSASVKLPSFTQITVNGKPEEQSAFNLPAGKWEIVVNPNKEPK
jgi:alpha-L-rhamnosidase